MADDHWEWVEKVFTFAINEDDNPPIPAPLFGIPEKAAQSSSGDRALSS
jgi:hypothetical protein